MDLTPPTDMIDTKSQEIKAADDETYSNMRELTDELPDSSPRFILLSYPYTLVRCLGADNEARIPKLTETRLAIRSNVRPLRFALLPARELQPEQ